MKKRLGDLYMMSKNTGYAVNDKLNMIITVEN